MVGFLVNIDQYDENEQGIIIDDLCYQRHYLHRLEYEGIFLLYKKKEGIVGYGVTTDTPYYIRLEPGVIPVWCFPIRFHEFKEPLNPGYLFKEGKLKIVNYEPFTYWGLFVYETEYPDEDVTTFILEGTKER